MAAADAPPLSLPSLPRDAALLILGQLPADARARCRAVSPSWRALLDGCCGADAWACVDLSRAGGATCTVTDAALVAASHHAQGRLQLLRVTGCDQLSALALAAVVCANAATLRELHAAGCAAELHDELQSVIADVASVPRLRLVELDLVCASHEVADVMGDARLHVRKLSLLSGDSLTKRLLRLRQRAERLSLEAL